MENYHVRMYTGSHEVRKVIYGDVRVPEGKRVHSSEFRWTINGKMTSEIQTKCIKIRRLRKLFEMTYVVVNQAAVIGGLLGRVNGGFKEYLNSELVIIVGSNRNKQRK